MFLFWFIGFVLPKILKSLLNLAMVCVIELLNCIMIRVL